MFGPDWTANLSAVCYLPYRAIPNELARVSQRPPTFWVFTTGLRSWEIQSVIGRHRLVRWVLDCGYSSLSCSGIGITVLCGARNWVRALRYWARSSSASGPGCAMGKCV